MDPPVGKVLCGNRILIPSGARGGSTLHAFSATGPRAGWVSGAEKAQARGDFEVDSEQLQSLDHTAWVDLLQSQDASIARKLLDEFLEVYINKVVPGEEGLFLKQKLDGLEQASLERLEKWKTLLQSLERIKMLPPGREKILAVISLSRDF